jgi:hypothetical protein
MAELTEAVAEVAESVAGDALTVAEVSRSLSGRDFGIGFVFGGIVSGVTTFWYLRRRLEAKYNKIAEDEIAEMRDHYRSKQAVASEKPKLDKIVEERGYVPPERGGLNVSINDPQTMGPVVFEENDEIETRNVFEHVREDWDYEAEVASRVPDRPYIIHQDEFSERDYTGVTLTYYENDGILIDEDKKPIDNKERLVGKDALNRFGHGADNPNIVYVRNEVLSIDIEIVKSEGSYTEEVHGFKHEDPSKRTKLDDET